MENSLLLLNGEGTCIIKKQNKLIETILCTSKNNPDTFNCVTGLEHVPKGEHTESSKLIHTASEQQPSNYVDTQIVREKNAKR